MKKFLFDFIPIVLFFGVFKWSKTHIDAAHALASAYFPSILSANTPMTEQVPILLATITAIVISVIQIAYLLARRRQVDAMLWLSLAIIVICGGATIYFHDATFIKWKPTVLYWCFAAILLGGHICKKNLMRAMLEKQLSLPQAAWNKLNLSWAIFFIVAGLCNIYIAYYCTLDTWVNFKVFGSMGLMLAFIVIQSLFLVKYIKYQ